MVQQNNIEANQNTGLSLNQLDFEFMTKGDPIVEAKDAAGRIQQNLTPQEIDEMTQLIPYVEKFMLLQIKAETGSIPSEEDANQLLQQAIGEIASVDEQGMAIEQGSGTRVPQDMQIKRKVPSRPVEGQVPQNAPEMMSGGGKVVDISDILEGDIPDWLKRALDPSTPTTENNETIRSMTGSLDGMQILVPTIRMVDGKLIKYNPDEAFKIAREKQDYLVLPAKTNEDVEKYSKAISDEIGKRRGMQMGGVAAGPIGVVDKPGADNSGVADDVPAESDGFVINAAAVRHAGLRDINDMIQDAVTYAEKQGMKLNFGKTPVDAEQILVSNGEVVIPDVIANIIGYDRLEKINNRGKKETEEKIQQQEQQPQQPAPTRQPAQPVMQAAEGGDIIPSIPTPKPESIVQRGLGEQMGDIEYVMEQQNLHPADEFKGITSPQQSEEETNTIYGIAPDRLYNAIITHEWANQDAKYGFAGIDASPYTKVTSAFGPAQYTTGVMDDIISNPKKYKIDQEALRLATNIRAAQTLVINLGNGFKKRGEFNARRAANTPKGKLALRTLGISSEEFQAMVKEGYFLPSTQPNAKGLPDSILGQNYEQNYRKLFDAVVQIKLNREDVTDLNSFLEKYHGSDKNPESNVIYRDGVLKILDN